MEQHQLTIERFFLRSPDINVALKITVKRFLSRETFDTILPLMILKHPLLSVAVELKANKIAYYKTKHYRADDLIDFFDNDNADWMQWYHDADNKLYNLQDGPLFKLGVFFRPTKKITDIVLIGHHVVGDGMAFVTIARTFLEILNGYTPTESVIPPFFGIRSSLKRNVKTGLLKRYYSQKINKWWKKTGHIFTENEYKTFRDEYRKNNKSGDFIKRIDSRLLSKIIEKSHKAGVSVNEFIACVLTYSLQKSPIINTNQIELGISINIRNDVTPEADNCLGDFVSGVLVRTGYNPDKSFNENLQHFRKKVRGKVQNKRTRYNPILFSMNLEPDLLDSIYFAEYGNYQNKAAKQLARALGERNRDKGVGISNLGKIDFGVSDKFPVDDVVFIPPAYPANFLTLGIITFNNSMNICFRYNKKYVSFFELKKIYVDFLSAIDKHS